MVRLLLEIGSTGIGHLNIQT